MAEPYKHIYKVDLNQQLVRRDVGLLATFDSKANRFGAELYRDGASVSASGYTVTGYFIRPDDKTVHCSGTVEGNLVYVDLLPACYLYDGAFECTLKIKQGDEEKSVLMCYGNVVRSRTDATVSGGGVTVNVTNAEKLGGVAASEYLQKSQVVNNYTTTKEGFIADARILRDIDQRIKHIRYTSPVQTMSFEIGETQTYNIENCDSANNLTPVGVITNGNAVLVITNTWPSGTTRATRLTNISGKKLTDISVQLVCLNIGGIINW